jgi:SpoIVB peptidase S55
MHGLAVGFSLSFVGVAGAMAAAPASVAAAAGKCPAAFPVAQLRDGQSASGLTVSKGETPEPFTVKITGVLRDGIAPGIDMILASTDSAAIRAAGGVWAGMSGSPVYATDGRLIGAIAYGLASASNVAGITPAAAMYENLTLGLGARVATSAQAAGGLRPLPTPVGVSGLHASRLATFKAGLEGKGLTNTILYSSAARTAGTAPASKVLPGGNFAALLASGDATLGGVGTTTAICGGKALAFGHPFTLGGTVADSANLADALYIQQDNLFGPFKVANIGATVGTLDQDRLAAVRATLGTTPRSTSVRSIVTSNTTGVSRTGTTSVYDHRIIADATAIHLVANLDRVAQKIGEGSATVGWDVRGTTASGAPFRLTRSNKYASLEDVTLESTLELLGQLSVIESNRFTDPSFDSISLTASTDEQYRAYTVTRLEVRKNGAYVPVVAGDVVEARAKRNLALRVTLTPYRGRGSTKTLYMTLPVPNAAGSEASLSVGAQAQPSDGEPSGEPAAASFDELITSLDNAPTNTAVLARLEVPSLTSPTPMRVDRVTNVDQVVQGSVSARVRIVP